MNSALERLRELRARRQKPVAGLQSKLESESPQRSTTNGSVEGNEYAAEPNDLERCHQIVKCQESQPSSGGTLGEIESDQNDGPNHSDSNSGWIADPTLGGLVNHGWRPLRWADELERKANCCVEVNPVIAENYRQQAVAIRAAVRNQIG